VINKLSTDSGTNDIPDAMRQRLDKLVDALGNAGKLARICLAAEVSFLFERAPAWTKSKIVPLFDWSSVDAADAWAARKYSNIGSPELFGLTKKPFLEIFGRSNLPSDELRTFADWLTVIYIVNRSRKKEIYPISATEGRAALRRAGVEALSSVGHRLAIEMEAAPPEQKVERWRDIIAPVFNAIWPLDIDLQSHVTTFKLVQILRATGEVFPEAADVIIPFVRPDNPQSQSAIFSISEAPDSLYKSSPEKILDLIAAVVGEPTPRSVYALDKALSRVRAFAPSLAETRKFQKLLSYALI
jgi:hypothetical protein